MTQLHFTSTMNSDIAKQIHINPLFINLIRKLNEEEENQLLNNLMVNGCRDAIIVDELYQILDGHNRYRICNQNNIPFNIIQITNFNTDKDKLDYIIANQLSRRNLTNEEKKLLIGNLYINSKMETGANQYTESGGERHSPPQKTAIKIANDNNVSSRFVYNSANYVTGLELIKYFFDKFQPGEGTRVYNSIKNGTEKFFLNTSDIQQLAKFKNEDFEEFDVENEMRKIYDIYNKYQEELELHNEENDIPFLEDDPDYKLRQLANNNAIKKASSPKMKKQIEKPTEEEILNIKEVFNKIDFETIQKTSPINFMVKVNSYIIKIQQTPV